MSTIVNLQSILDANLLTRPNFLDWLKNLRIVLDEEKLAYVITKPIPGSSIVDAPKSVQRAYKKHLVDSARVGLIIHSSKSPEFQKRYKTEDAYSIVCHLREHYNEQVAFEGFKVTRLLFNSKMEVGTSLVQYALKMYNHIKRLDQLGNWMDPEFSIDLILARLPDSFAQFVLNYEMVYKVPTIPKLINVLGMDEGKMEKKKGKETTPKGTSSKGICFHCSQDGHWKRNYKAYLESKNKGACDAPSSSCIYVVTVNTVSLNNIWVCDTSCGSYIWFDMQGPRNSRKLTKGESDLRSGNGARVVVVSAGTYVLNLPCNFI